jgi:hypothetical protein
MQFDPLRAFPYPVLQPEVDDYLEGDLQVTVEFQPSADGHDVSATASFLVSVPEIVERIKTGEAAYVLSFACRDTYFRHVETTDSAEITVNFPPGSLRGEVQVSPYIAAIKPITDFKCPWINPEFGSGPISYDVGSVLALDRPQIVFIDKDVFRPLSSVFELVRDDALSGHEWQITAGEDKVQIKVSNHLKDRIDVARNSKARRAVLINSIYFSAVMQCVSFIKRDGVDNYGRWAKIIEQKCHNANLPIDSTDEYLITERLMKAPFQLVDAYVFVSGDE